MEITISQKSGRANVAVIKVAGSLDGGTYEQLIAKAREVYEGGARDMLLDLSDLTFISSAGLVALHVVALMTRGEALPDIQKGWGALKSMDKTRGGLQRHVKLLNPRSEVLDVLEMVGFKQFFEIYTDLDEAVQSF